MRSAWCGRAGFPAGARPDLRPQTGCEMGTGSGAQTVYDTRVYVQKIHIQYVIWLRKHERVVRKGWCLLGRGPLGCARAPGPRGALVAGRKQCIVPVFMYNKYTFNTPEGGMQSYFCDKYNNACARRRAQLHRTAPGFLAPGGRVGRWLSGANSV